MNGIKRFMSYSPQELINLDKTQFLEGIRAAEGRTVGSVVCPGGPNLVDYVSNFELAAAFGTDFIIYEGSNPLHLTVPGLPSKDPKVDEPFSRVGLTVGDGWTIRELIELIGRPIGGNLYIPAPGEVVSPLFTTSIFSEERVLAVRDAGYSFIVVSSFDNDCLVEGIRTASRLVGDTMPILTGMSHGPGAWGGAPVPYNLREVCTKELVVAMIEAGGDIIDIPAAGVMPGATPEYVSGLIDLIHENKALAQVSIAHSFEGSKSGTVQQIVHTNKMCGADIIATGGGGYFESMAIPETLFEVCIAAKGRRHTFKRMAESILR